MTSDLSRRNVARGAAWAIPTIAVASAAPATAASPCAGVVKGQPLPVSAFQLTYMCDTNESFGDAISPKQIALDFGFSVTAAAVACGASGAMTSTNGTPASRVQLSNGKTYNLTNGQSIPANGRVGVIDTGCRSGLAGTQACGTSLASAYSAAGSQSTNKEHVTAISLARSVTVAGYGTTTIFLNGSGFGATVGTNDCATGMTVSAAAAF